jgi:hypothetical protein
MLHILSYHNYHHCFRFASDFDTIDFRIPLGLAACADALLSVGTSLLLLCWFAPVLALPLAPVLYLYARLQSR